MKLFQSYIGTEQRAFVTGKAIPFDASKNTAPDTREYELFKAIFDQRLYGDENECWSMVSWKFEHKSLISADAFQAFCERKFSEGQDCVFINPMIGNEALYHNVWEQGAHVHPGMETIISYLASDLKLPVHAAMGTDTFAMCDYFAGNKIFWTAYFDFVDGVTRQLAEQEKLKSRAGAAYAGSAGYARDAGTAMRPFVTERLFSTFLKSNTTIKWAEYRYPQAVYEQKFGSQIGGFLYALSSVKNRALSANDDAQLKYWNRMRGKILTDHGVLAAWLQLDDPLPYFLSAESLEFRAFAKRPT